MVFQISSFNLQDDTFGYDYTHFTDEETEAQSL